MHYRILINLIILKSLFVSTNVFSEEFDDDAIGYTYVGINVVDTDSDGGNSDGDGLEIYGSYQVNERFFVLASFTEIDFDDNRRRQDYSSEKLRIGGGLIIPQDGFDFTTEVSYVSIDNGEDDDTGLNLAAGGRKMFLPDIEARAYLVHSTVGNNDTFLKFSGFYYLNDNIALGLSLNVASNDDVISFGGRYYF
jgi:hypothetical protein